MFWKVNLKFIYEFNESNDEIFNIFYKLTNNNCSQNKFNFT